MMMEELRVGIIGMGKMGLLHSGILNSLPKVKVKAIAEPEKFVTSIFRSISEVETFTDYKKMIKDSKLDLVYITTPVNLHIPMASFCVDNKVNFFVEKPLGKNVEECEDLCTKLQNENITNMVGFYLRFAETFAKTKELLEKKTIGKIIGIKSSVYQSQFLKKPSGWRFKKESSGGGVLIDLGTHLIDLLLWYFGKISSVDGKIESNFSDQVEDTASAEIKFENGLKGIMETSWNVKNYRLQETTIEIEGEMGKMKVNEDYVDIQYNPVEKNKNQRLYRQSLYRGVPIDIGGPEYTREDIDFVECIRNNQQSMLNVNSASRTQSVVDAIYKSSKKKSVEMVRYIE